MTAEELEDWCIERLKDRLPYGVACEGFPDDIEAYTVIAPNGAVLINAFGADYEEPTSANAQKRDREILFYIGAPSLRSTEAHKGSYALLEHVRDLIAGRKVDRNRFYVGGEGYVARKEGVHWYRLLMKLRDTYTPPTDEQLAERESEEL